MRGHIKKRSEGSWSIVVDLGRNPSTGKRQQKWSTVRRTKRDAERKLAGWQHQLDTGEYVKPTRLTVAELLQVWLRDYAYVHVRPRTYEGYATIVERHLIPGLGAISVSQLEAAHIQKYYAKSLIEGRSDGKGGLSPQIIKHHHRVLSQVLAYAVRMNMVARNVSQAVIPPRPLTKEIRTLGEDGVRAFLEAAKQTPYYHLFHLALYTGLRRSELLGLRLPGKPLALPKECTGLRVGMWYS